MLGARGGHLAGFVLLSLAWSINQRVFPGGGGNSSNGTPTVYQKQQCWAQSGADGASEHASTSAKSILGVSSLGASRVSASARVSGIP